MRVVHLCIIAAPGHPAWQATTHDPALAPALARMNPGVGAFLLLRSPAKPTPESTASNARPYSASGRAICNTTYIRS